MDHKSMESMQEGKKKIAPTAANAAETVRDPVCGMTFKAGQAKFTEDYNGKTLYFCSDSCHKKFLADPAKYAASTQESELTAKDRAAMKHD
jgi:Cu+-exporting ATPase